MWKKSKGISEARVGRPKGFSMHWYAQYDDGSSSKLDNHLAILLLVCSTFCPSISCRFKMGIGASNHREGKKQLRPTILRQGASPPINNRKDPYQPMGALSLRSFESPRQNRAPLIDVSVCYKVGPPPNQQSTSGWL